jgi:glycosyltransferase involved in cell wall biosynthesis
MRWLWLTLADPEPATNGQLIYSKGLIEAAAGAGVSLTVIGLARPEHRRPAVDSRGIEWRLAEERPKSAWRRLLSRGPALTQRGSPALERTLAAALADRGWDAVVFDSLCAGWALRAVLRHRELSAGPARLVYIAHNHEVTVARRIAASAHGLRGVAKRIDLTKTIRLEHHLVSAADVITSNTPEDCLRFMADAGGRPIVHLPPGYDGPRVTTRIIDHSVPRRAILVGSLDWPPKRMAVEAFLHTAARSLAEAGVALQIVGEVEPAYLAELRRRFPSAEFVGRVDDVRPYLRGARLALVPDLLGGFKLKGLDYVFHRLPILAMRVALPGMPLEDRHSVALFDSHDDMARGVLALIDDFATLNGWQERAYVACSDRFDWDRIGRDLRAGVEAAVRQPPRPASASPTSARASQSAPLAAGK